MAKVRVRIAPSPTGTPHVGTAYIALFNYCFARSQGGDFILRIEDTDQARSKPEHEQTILEALRWTGLQWDEGPDVGGPHGSYRQSERTELYRKHAFELLAKGHAYRCFCSQERLEQLREDQKREGGGFGYDGHCLQLSAAQIFELETNGTPYTIRMKVPERGACEIHDPLRGQVSFDYTTVDHQVLLKSDRFPTYHLANVVDDHAMGITHVIRGEEWLPSLPKHRLLYEYFGWTAPEAVHLPLLRNQDGSKLSKRKNPTSILFYKETGILPEALVNFLGLMAYSLPSGEEFFNLGTMVESFDLSRIHLGGPIFDHQKLQWLNQKHIAALSETELFERLRDWRFNQSYIRKLLPLMAQRMHRLGDFMQHCDFMFYSEVTFDKDALTPKQKLAEDSRDYLQRLVWELETVIDFQADTIEAAFRKTAALHGWNIREATHSARVAISGKTVAPPLFQVMEILGSDLCRNRLMLAVEALGPLGKKKLAKLQSRYQQESEAYREDAQPEP